VGAGGRSKKFKIVVPMAAERPNFAKWRNFRSNSLTTSNR